MWNGYFTIGVIGTSLSSDNTSRNWPQRLRDKLQIGKSKRVVILPYGWGSTNSGAGYTGGSGPSYPNGQIQAAQVAAQKPDVVLMEFTINDASAAFGTTIDQHETNYAAIFSTVLTANPSCQIFVQVMGPMDATAAATAGITATYDDRTAKLASMYTRDRAIAANASYANVGLIDNDGALQPGESADGIHLAAAWYDRVLIPNAAAALAPLIT